MSEVPPWWPEWMTPPTGRGLGQCKECGAQQWTHEFHEIHSGKCSRHEGDFRGGPAPWPYLWDGK